MKLENRTFLWRRNLKGKIILRPKNFLFDLFFYFLFLEQLGLGLISHVVTSITWWYSHKTDYETWENLVKDSRTNDVIVICKSTCPENYIPAVMPPLNPISPPSMVATFLATCLMAVLQPSGYSVFHDGDTPIQLSLPWRSCSCQCLNTETSTRGNRGFTTETPSISYRISLYIRLVVTVMATTRHKVQQSHNE